MTFSIRSYAQNSEENPVTNSASGFELSKPGIEYALAPIEEEWYRLGLGDGLADVYEKKSGFSHTGYAEVVYQNFAQETNINTPSGRGSELNLASGVVFLGYRMNERLVINSEIRWARDLTDGHAGQFDVNSAYVDYLLNRSFSFRGGVILVPMGMVNEFHGPQEFLGTQRPSRKP